MAEPFKDRSSCKRVFSRGIRDVGGGREFEVVTPHGIVAGFVSRRNQRTHLDFAFNGYLHMWSYPKAYSQRWCAIEAGNMATQIARGLHDD